MKRKFSMIFTVIIATFIVCAWALAFFGLKNSTVLVSLFPKN